MPPFHRAMSGQPILANGESVLCEMDRSLLTHKMLIFIIIIRDMAGSIRDGALITATPVMQVH